MATLSTFSVGGVRNGCVSKPSSEYQLEGKSGPAAAVIPAPAVYTNTAAVKKLVVECRVAGAGWLVLLFSLATALLGGQRGRGGGHVMVEVACYRDSTAYLRLALTGERYPSASLLHW